LCDTERKIGVQYGAADDPSARSAKRITYVIDEKGKVAHVYDVKKAAENPDDVKRDLKA
jgi:peroxiredoxin